MTNTSNMPIEATEMEFTKILARKYELKEDTGGAGQFRGGLGIERELEVLQDDVAYTGLGDRHKFHPWGLAGGKRAQQAHSTALRQTAPSQRWAIRRQASR